VNVRQQDNPRGLELGLKLVHTSTFLCLLTLTESGAVQSARDPWCNPSLLTTTSKSQRISTLLHIIHTSNSQPRDQLRKAQRQQQHRPESHSYPFLVESGDRLTHQFLATIPCLGRITNHRPTTTNTRTAHQLSGTND
jgi:hypothetical protein